MIRKWLFGFKRPKIVMLSIHILKAMEMALIHHRKLGGNNLSMLVIGHKSPDITRVMRLMEISVCLTYIC